MSTRSTVARLDQQASLFQSIGRLQDLKLTILDTDLALNRYISSADDQILNYFTNLLKSAKAKVEAIGDGTDGQTLNIRATVLPAVET